MIQSADPRSLMGGRHPLASSRHSNIVPLGRGALPHTTRFIMLEEGWHGRWANTPSEAAFLHMMIARGVPELT